MGCDICGSEIKGTEANSYSAKDFKVLVSKGFEPDKKTVSNWMDVLKESGMTRKQVVERWKRELVGQSQDSWILCRSCAKRASKYKIPAKRVILITELPQHEQNLISDLNELMEKIREQQHPTLISASFPSVLALTKAISKLSFAKLEGDQISLPKHMLWGMFQTGPTNLNLVIGGTLLENERSDIVKVCKKYGDLKTLLPRS